MCSFFLTTTPKRNDHICLMILLMIMVNQYRNYMNNQLFSMNKQPRNSDKQSFQQQIINEAALKHLKYSYTQTLEPTVFFWKQLLCGSPSHAPAILVPDTLIINEKDIELMWVYTNSQSGKISKQLNTSYKDFVMKITNFTSPNELVAILKRPIFQQRLGYTNQYKLFNSKYLQNSSQQQIVPQKNQVVCLQKYVKSAGSKVFICRTIYQKNKAPRCYLLTSKNTTFYNSNQMSKQQQNDHKRLVIKSSNHQQTICIKSKTGTNLQQTLKYLQQITKYMLFVKGIELSELVGDFIKDESDNWWLINIKAFKVQEKMYVMKEKDAKTQQQDLLSANKVILSENAKQLEKQRYQKTKMCRYCQKNYLQPELTYKMTMKMIIEVDKYLVHMGKWDKWLKRSDITNVEVHCLYQEHKVCERCYRLYSQIQELMQIEQKYLKKIGYTLESSPKQLIISQTNEQQLWNQSKSKQIHRLSEGIPSIIELGPNTNITIIDNKPVCNDQIINKMIRFRFIIFLNEIDQAIDIDESSTYFIELNIFDKKTRYRLDKGLLGSESLSGNSKFIKNCSKLSQNSEQPLNIIPLKKLKVIYFFANSIEEVQEYVKSGAALQINLIAESKSFSGDLSGVPMAGSQLSSYSRGDLKQSTMSIKNTKKDEGVQRKIVGELRLQLKQFFTFSATNSKKDFYKFFDVKGVPYGWGLQGSIGVIPSEGYVNTSRIIFEKTDKYIYLPNSNYYLCEHLPEQWINHIKQKHEQSKKYYYIKSQPNQNTTTSRLSYSQIKTNNGSGVQKRHKRKPSAFMIRDQSIEVENRPLCLKKDKNKNKREIEGKENASKKSVEDSWKDLLSQQINWYENKGKSIKKQSKRNTESILKRT